MEPFLAKTIQLYETTLVRASGRYGAGLVGYLRSVLPQGLCIAARRRAAEQAGLQLNSPSCRPA